ncbi:serine/threonine-protein kinase [Nonomuraea sp. NPDC050536]|uniref:serine/threonine-protein kinase n=1 Tax=Nonomuraea sp. NPDC050536 TaxID=3364366 RepID=UPI0037C9F587
MIVGGRYRLLRTIGHGGMGTVWQAHDEVLGRDVAVKEILPPPDLTGPEREVFSVRTLREARAAGRVAHPGVATVYDVLEEGGHPWIVMQLVRSTTLGERVRDHGPLPVVQVAAIGLQVLEALRAAHAAGVMHRDVKPDNVLLAEDGRAVLTDFGIATAEGEVQVTRTGEVVGTPAYMAPERAVGGKAYPASDLWSLGATLYLAVEGQSPFRRETALTTLGAVMHADLPPMVRAGALGPVLEGLLCKDPAERMPLDEAERRLHTIVAGTGPEPTAPVTVPPWRRRGPLAALAVGTLVVALGAGGAAWLSRRADPARLPPSEPAVVTDSFTSQQPVRQGPAQATPTYAPSRTTQPTQPTPTRARTPTSTPTRTHTKTGKPTAKASRTADRVEPSDGG